MLEPLDDTLARTEWAARTANVVFPSPAEPVMSPTTPTPGELSTYTSSLNQISSSARPVKSSTIRGSSHTPLCRAQWSRSRPSRASSISRVRSLSSSFSASAGAVTVRA
ncbi:hypothetical protein [Streptomyces sp. NPDC026092]|uniref:hypothetical protein n=1 Tax=Streptomyces sp. NPDC026092 TaxID=3154797 RepID=UPI0033E6C714